MKTTKKLLKSIIKDLENEIDYWYDMNKGKDSYIKELEEAAMYDAMAFSEKDKRIEELRGYLIDIAFDIVNQEDKLVIN